MKLYCDNSDRPLEPPDSRHSSPDLEDSDLPTESFVVDGPLQSRSKAEALPGRTATNLRLFVKFTIVNARRESCL